MMPADHIRVSSVPTPFCVPNAHMRFCVSFILLPVTLSEPGQRSSSAYLFMYCEVVGNRVVMTEVNGEADVTSKK